MAGQRSFPWEKVTLLIEYEPLKQPLFENGQPGASSQGESETPKTNDGEGKTLNVERLKLREYLTLKTAFKSSVEGLPKACATSYNVLLKLDFLLFRCMILVL